jgi:hypothetical protein
MLSEPLPPRGQSKNALRYDGLKGELANSFLVIWEIILRDFWGDILRDLLTRALNLCPIRCTKALSSTTEDRHGVRWQTA